MTARPEGINVKRPRAVFDAATLPTQVFGHRGLLWWGWLGFQAAEGMTLVLCAASYLYLRKNFDAWPPFGTPLPSLLMPTIQIAVMLVSCIPAALVKRKALALDRDGVRLWLVPQSVLGLATLVLRWYEFPALNTRWDSNAYGSIVWIILLFHATVLVFDVFDTCGTAVIFLTGRDRKKHLPDAVDNSNYWYFVVGSWVLLYLLVFWGPRLF